MKAIFIFLKGLAIVKYFLRPESEPLMKVFLQILQNFTVRKICNRQLKNVSITF